jgi:hypothetical protein
MALQLCGLRERKKRTRNLYGRSLKFSLTRIYGARSEIMNDPFDSMED